jgi:hypothetical protein
MLGVKGAGGTQNPDENSQRDHDDQRSDTRSVELPGLRVSPAAAMVLCLHFGCAVAL